MGSYEKLGPAGEAGGYPSPSAYPQHGYDVENQQLLYPSITPLENTLRLGFIRKVFGILATQIAMTAGVAALMMRTPALLHFVQSSPAFLICVGLVLPLALLPALYCYRQSHPLNLALLGAWTVSLSFGVGMACAAVSSLVLIEAVGLTAAVLVGLFAYTFYAARKGHDLGYLGPMLFAGLVALMAWGVLQIFFPLPGLQLPMACASAVLFAGYVVYDVNELVRRTPLDDYIWASVQLYLDVLNLFLRILEIVNHLNKK